MNDSDENQRLDEAIDSLLKSNPLKAPEAFSERIMASVEHEATSSGKSVSKRSTLHKLWPYALPLAAMLALAALLWPSLQNPQASPTLTFEETQEIIELEESLRALVPLQEAGEFSTDGLLATLETATYAL
jgi:hypothetical protein